MNLRFLGDALDHWKGSVFERLQEEKLLKKLLVDPMATDASPWNKVDSKLYARLLRIEERQLVQHNRTLREDRKRYFSEIRQTGDLFLDPDTGIKTSGRNQIENYVLPEELFHAIGTEEDRLVVVYQHVSREVTRQRVQNVWATLKAQKKAFSCASYESPQVALLFFSRTCGRVEAVRDCFRRFLGTHANNRIGWYNS